MTIPGVDGIPDIVLKRPVLTPNVGVFNTERTGAIKTKPGSMVELTRLPCENEVKPSTLSSSSRPYGLESLSHWVGSQGQGGAWGWMMDDG